MLLNKKTGIVAWIASVFLILFIISIALLGFGDIAHAGIFEDSVNCTGTDCQLCNLFELINGVINFLMLSVAAPLAAISFAIAGIMFFTAGGNEGKITKAKSIFLYVVIGIIIALAAFIIIDTIMKSLLPNNGTTRFGPWNSVQCASIINIEIESPGIGTKLV